MDSHHPLPGDGPWQRFIVKFRPGSEPAREPDAARERVRRMDLGTGQGTGLAWVRRLGVGADLFVAAEPLQRDVAEQLLQALAADPDVEYAEAEMMMKALDGASGPQGPP